MSHPALIASKYSANSRSASGTPSSIAAPIVTPKPEQCVPEKKPDRLAVGVPAPLCYALAPHWGWTALGILFLQLSVFNTPAISVYLSLGIPRDRIAAVMTTVFSAYSLGLIASSVLSGWLAQVVGAEEHAWFAGDDMAPFGPAFGLFSKRFFFRARRQPPAAAASDTLLPSRTRPT